MRVQPDDVLRHSGVDPDVEERFPHSNPCGSSSERGLDHVEAFQAVRNKEIGPLTSDMLTVYHSTNFRVPGWASHTAGDRDRLTQPFSDGVEHVQESCGGLHGEVYGTMPASTVIQVWISGQREVFSQRTTTRAERVPMRVPVARYYTISSNSVTSMFL